MKIEALLAGGHHLPGEQDELLELGVVLKFIDIGSDITRELLLPKIVMMDADRINK